MQYKAIIFDFFDVIHSDPFHAWMVAHGLTREGEQAAVSKDVDSGHITMQQFYERLGHITSQTGAEVEAEFTQSMRVDQEVVALIGELQSQFTIAVVSNAESDFLRQLIKEHNLEPLFEHIVISSEVGYPKPSPEIFQHALERLQISPEEAIFIDDNPDNVTAAEQLGITSICHTDATSLRRSLAALGIAVEA